ncbi:hypothetical protein [Desulfovibrio sp. MES5]|uniref:hypothetical protein n=1 Tax=Desulfovibrio sp. MES5 TaxID=1899016 RepID=UPI0025C26E20|nr:hypothetical protein [Desulfovibrio sp. MES5]
MIKEKPPCPQGTQTAFQRTSPALSSSERQPAALHFTAAQSAKTAEKEKPHAHNRAQNPHRKGQALFCFL